MSSLDETRARLKSHFHQAETAQHGSRWEDLWHAGGFLPWDRAKPNPALEDVLVDRQDLTGGPVVQGSGEAKRRKRALVPGCGRGYDVLLLASFGYDAYGLEVSQTAVERCKEEQGKNGSIYSARDPSLGLGNVTFLHGDFFAEDWLGALESDGKVDLIYDYTFLSALPPSLRPAWALRMSQLLAHEGCLVCIEFPTAKDPTTGGPPWALPPPVYAEHLSHPGEEIAYDEASGRITEDPSRSKNAAALTRIAHWQPSRTHEIGQGTDWVGVWRH